MAEPEPEPPAEPATLTWAQRSWQPGIFDPQRIYDIGIPSDISDSEQLGVLAARPDVDPTRTHVAGFPNGAMMATHFVCNHATTPVAGLALGAGPAWNTSGCATKDLRIYAHHGTPDVIVPYHGGTGVGSLVSTSSFRAAPAVATELAAHLGCDPEHTDTVLVAEPLVTDRSWDGCERGAMRFVTTTHHHLWPRQAGWHTETDILDFLGL